MGQISRGVNRMASTAIPLGGVLDRASISELVASSNPLVDGYLDLEAQLQPNGFDLTLKDVAEYTSAGQVGPGTGRAHLPQSSPRLFDLDGFMNLSGGAYVITLNEVINLPLDLMALALPRSSLLRCGAAIHTAVWDAGYHGRSQALLSVHNPFGFRLAKDARILQMVFLRLARSVEAGYEGRFQEENL